MKRLIRKSQGGDSSNSYNVQNVAPVFGKNGSYKRDLQIIKNGNGMQRQIIYHPGSQAPDTIYIPILNNKPLYGNATGTNHGNINKAGIPVNTNKDAYGIADSDYNYLKKLAVLKHGKRSVE